MNLMLCREAYRYLRLAGDEARVAHHHHVGDAEDAYRHLRGGHEARRRHEEDAV
mgnify:CR=1 FL=1